jgi:hypothetical protein
MEGFDTMTMNYLASPLSLGNMPGADYLNAMNPMEMGDQHSNFDAETFVRWDLEPGTVFASAANFPDSGDDMSFAQSLQHPGMKRFSSGFNDPFQMDMGQFDGLPPDQTVPESSVDRDNKLLGFSLPIYNFTLLDYSLRRTNLSLAAQLHGMFFLAESPWTSAGDAAPPPPELTCYRRNLFQITGSITLPRTLRYIMTEQGDRIPILAQELTISATESVEGNPVKIISVPWKTPATGTSAPEDKTEKEPPSLPLDTMAGQDLDSDYATFPIAWKRLQFRIATANNGRRKELQQHFVVRLKIVATLSTGAKISIAEAHSGPIIVRGRSPRNFQSRKDFPISGSTSSARKSLQQQQPPAMTRTSTGDSVPQQQTSAAKREKTPEVPQMIFQYNENELQPSPGFPDWTQISTTTTQPLVPALSTPTYPLPNPMSAMPAPMPSLPPQQAYSQALSSPDVPTPQTHPPIQRPSSHPTPTSGPLPLSLLDSDFDSPPPPPSNTHTKAKRPAPTPTTSKSRPSSSTIQNPTPSSQLPSQPQPYNQSQNPPTNALKRKTLHPTQPPPPQPIYSQTTTSSTPDDSADLLYEYIPLGLDDWMPPVDAVYRPHVVHHTAPLPPDPKEVAAAARGLGARGMGRSKRYFSEDH